MKLTFPSCRHRLSDYLSLDVCEKFQTNKYVNRILFNIIFILVKMTCSVCLCLVVSVQPLDMAKRNKMAYFE